MSAHTPGPWKHGSSSPTEIHIGPVVDDAYGRRIACVIYDGDITCTGNARLMAAAPELVAALELVTHCLAWHTDIHGQAMDSHALATARAAIAKARGAA